jgi:hypothetical protein
MEISAWSIVTSFVGAGGLLSPGLSIKKSTLAAIRLTMANTIKNFALAAVFIGRKRLLKGTPLQMLGQTLDFLKY